MKKTAILLSFILFTITAFGQKVSLDKLPASVAASFKSKYPTAGKVNWQLANANEYRANFVMKKTLKSAYFGADGPWRQTETQLKTIELPKMIRQSVSKQFVGYAIKRALKIEKREGAAAYEVLIKKGTKSYSVTYAVTGEMLRKREGV